MSWNKCEVKLCFFNLYVFVPLNIFPVVKDDLPWTETFNYIVKIWNLTLYHTIRTFIDPELKAY